jgi:transposase
MTPEQRLHFHQDNSGPLMKNLHQWLEQQFAEKKVEPNSSLGKAINYMLNHWSALTLFLRVEKAPLDIISANGLSRCQLYIEKTLFFQNRAWGVYR